MGKKHCCEMMEEQVSYICPDHEDPFDCPDNLIKYSARFDEYGIIVHDGGNSTETISFCPWCGSKLPESKRERWRIELEELGFEDPWIQDIPQKYQTDAWYQPEN